MKVTAKELAARINGCEYGCELAQEDINDARESGLVIVYGASDDLIELSGAMCDEVDVYEGGTIGIMPGRDALTEDDNLDGVSTIKALWNVPGTADWTYETEIPHETFNVYEDGELYCIGIVFALDDCKGGRLTTEELRAENEKLKRALEAAKEDIREMIIAAVYPRCSVYCKNVRECIAHEDDQDYDCIDHAEWRGLCAENGGKGR